MKVIKFDHKNLGTWYTDELQERVAQGNGEQRRQYKQGGKSKNKIRGNGGDRGTN